MHYRAPRWLPGGHLQTIFTAKCIPVPRVKYRRERWDTPDGDFIDVDFVDGQVGKPYLVLFHGLEGSSDSHYVRAIMAYIRELGWSGAIPHFRSCSGEINRAPRFYHCGDSAEIDWILRRLAAVRDARLGSKFYAAGASLGGNALLRWLGESQHSADFVDAACTISAPLCLSSGGIALSRGFTRIYAAMFLKTLKPKSLEKLQQFPGLFDGEALRRVNNLYDFDNIVTAPLHGFRDTDDYWDRASAKHVLSDITVPTLVLNARNDPFLPARHLPGKAAPCVLLEFPNHGGHIGFAGPGIFAFNWLPERLVAFLEGKVQPKIKNPEAGSACPAPGSTS